LHKTKDLTISNNLSGLIILRGEGTCLPWAAPRAVQGTPGLCGASHTPVSLHFLGVGMFKNVGACLKQMETNKEDEKRLTCFVVRRFWPWRSARQVAVAGGLEREDDDVTVSTLI